MVAATVAGLSSSLFYLAVYGFTTVGAFAVVTLVRDPAGEANHLSRWAGLGRRSPVVAGVFVVLAIAGASMFAWLGPLSRWAEATGMAVCETQAGKSAMPWNHPLALGAIGATGTRPTAFIAYPSCCL